MMGCVVQSLLVLHYDAVAILLHYSAPVSRSSLTDVDVWSSATFDTAAVDVSSQVVAVDCSQLT